MTRLKDILSARVYRMKHPVCSALNFCPLNVKHVLEGYTLDLENGSRERSDKIDVRLEKMGFEIVQSRLPVGPSKREFELVRARTYVNT